MFDNIDNIIVNATKGNGFELSLKTDDSTEEFVSPSDNSGEIVSMAYSEKKAAHSAKFLTRFMLTEF